MKYKGLELDRFQVEAIDSIAANRSVIVAAPTGAGKTLIAEYALERCLADCRKAIYTAPIKALSNQKYRDFSRLYGDSVGIMTGDVTINPDAPVMIMTTEIFRNTIFESPARLKDISWVVFDEIHFLDDLERGTVWEESIIFAPEPVRFVFLSATVSNLSEFSAWISEVRGSELKVVQEEGRPVPLRHELFIDGVGPGGIEDFEKAWKRRAGRRNAGRDRGRRRARPVRDDGPDPVKVLAHRADLPALVFSFSRQECEDKAWKYRNVPVLRSAEQDELVGEFDRLASAFGLESSQRAREMRGLVVGGVAYHHAGLLPSLKEVVERLFTSGRIKLLFATDTFALGVNMPAKSVVVSEIMKFDGVRRNPLKSREYQQMAGRAGRRGIDTVGRVFACVDPDRDLPNTARRVVSGTPEDVNSRFSLSYAALLALYGRVGAEKLYEACEKSFLAFQKKSRSPGVFRWMIGQVAARLGFLEKLGYIGDGAVTDIGRRAALLYGYEIQVAELYRRGILHGCDADRMAALFCALVFEEKSKDWYRQAPRRSFGPILGRVRSTVSSLQGQERKLGIRDLMKEPGFGIVSAALSWARGSPFDALERDTTASDGDLVRGFRMANQLLREAERAFADDDHLCATLRSARRKINRDEVDAERQLKQGADLDEAGVTVEGGD